MSTLKQEREIYDSYMKEDEKANLVVTMPRALRNKLKVKAALQDTTIKEVIIEAINEFLNSENKESNE